MRFRVSPNCTWIILMLFALVSTNGLSQEVHLVKDLSQKESNRQGSNAFNYFTLGQYTYFFTNYNTGVMELWKSDGTSVGTERVLRFVPGSFVTSHNKSSMLYKGKFYFSMSNPTHGHELWVTDGTEAGTKMVTEIASGRNSASPSDFTIYKDKIYFVAYAPSHGRELWYTDGTAAGTNVLDLIPGSTGSVPSTLVVADGKLFFIARSLNGAGSQELWVSDGTQAGTSNFIRISQWPGQSSFVSQLTATNDGLYFVARDSTMRYEIYKTNGTAQGTRKVIPNSPGTINGPSGLHMLGQTLVFSQYTSAYGVELWRSDGTSSGTVLLKDILPQSGTGVIQGRYQQVGNLLYFIANDGVHGYELWKTDGTTAGTQMVKDIIPGNNTFVSNLFYDAQMNGKLYFSVHDQMGNGTLWVSDGTASGTELISQVNPDMATHISMIYASNNRIHFTALDGLHGYEPWVSDGTESGTKMLLNINKQTEDSHPNGFSQVGEYVVFSAMVDQQRVMVSTKGDEESTVLLVDEDDPNNSPVPGLLHSVFYNGGLYFSAFTEKHGTELWYTDGTMENTYMVKDIMEGSFNSTPAHFNIYDNVLYFGVNNEFWGHAELYRTKGTAETTKRVKSLWGETQRSFMNTMVATDNKLFYLMNTVENGTELYTSDGTENGSVMVKDLCPGTCTGISFLDPRGIDSGQLFFSAHNNRDGMELWRTDGTKSGTYMVKDINTNRSSNPTFLGKINGYMMFGAQSLEQGRELWRTDGTRSGTSLVKDLNYGSGSSSPIEGAIINNELYFTAYHPSYGQEVWKTDGTKGGTVRVTDINPGTAHSSPRQLTALNDTLYFSAMNDTYGMELWKYHPSYTEAKLVHDIAPGNLSSAPNQLTAVGNRLYFAATDPKYGMEAYYITDPNYTPPAQNPIGEEEEEESFVLYPNPTNDRVTLKWDNRKDDWYTVVVYNIMGQTIYEKSTNESLVVIDMSEFESGAYVAELKGMGVKKFLKF